MLYFTPVYDEHEWISALYVVKLLKAHTFFSFLDNMFKKFNSHDSEISRVIKLLVFLLILIQVLGCLWVKLSINNYDPDNWITTVGFEKNELAKIYFSAVYFAAVTSTTIGYGDFAGSLHSEILFIVI